MFVTFTSRASFMTYWRHRVSPFLSFIFFLFFLLSFRPPKAARFRKNCQSYGPETFCDISELHCAVRKGRSKRLTHDLDLYGVKVTFLHLGFQRIYCWTDRHLTLPQYSLYSWLLNQGIKSRAVWTRCDLDPGFYFRHDPDSRFLS